MEVMGWIFVALLLCLVLAILTYLRQSQNVSPSGVKSKSKSELTQYFLMFIFSQGRRDGGRRRLCPEVQEAGELAGG